MTKRELFYDVETDPLRDLCYLHGFVERVSGAERYIPIFVDDPADAAAESQAFANAMTLLRAQDAAVYVYSAYERTTLKALARKFPQVATETEVEAILGGPRAVDLYLDVVRPATEWSTNDFSIKTLAKYLGFNWRDTNPSGAASIEWFHQWTGSRDPAVKQRILDYNEDDCRAMRVLLDAVRGLRGGRN